MTKVIIGIFQVVKSYLEIRYGIIAEFKVIDVLRVVGFQAEVEGVMNDSLTQVMDAIDG